ncbi:pyridoxal phosphate-dependent aminotransferase [Candidatus Bipolaricaulota bacterium]|nr:pyridoxal phosphate-dependent aminotransferase [Candidatus Bipolaricaulota bacterium]TFH09351.1 MAG: pyridoxal phosphate-dependent aminotransferase [Candidatus Atribacteria bacterium]
MHTDSTFDDARFQQLVDRRSTESIKWNAYDEDVLPMWVADMDFLCPPQVIEAIQERVKHGIFGYPTEPPRLRSIIVDRLKRRYDWTIRPEWITYIPNVFSGFHLAAHAVTRPGDGVLLTTPLYFPMLLVPGNVELKGQIVELVRAEDGTYTVPMARFESAVTGRSELFILCNPHNPIGKVYTRNELEELAEVCLKHDLIICSDEIHADFLYDGRRHVPIASLSREIADRTITLMSPVKSFNVAGIPFAFAVIPNPGLREQYQGAGKGLVIHPSALGYVAAQAAFEHCDGWSADLMKVLEANRALASDFIAAEMPSVKMTPMEGTYLAWLDFRNAGMKTSPYEFLLEKARVATVDGAKFGPGGEGFVRLNMACPQSRLHEGLRRICDALT